MICFMRFTTQKRIRTKKIIYMFLRYHMSSSVFALTLRTQKHAISVWQRTRAWAAISAAFSVRPGAPRPARCSAARDFGVAAHAGAGRYLGPPRIAVQGRFFGPPQGPPPARCSAARLRKPASGGRPRSGAPHATSTSVSVSAAHAGVTITLKFSFGVEPSPQ